MLLWWACFVRRNSHATVYLVLHIFKNIRVEECTHIANLCLQNVLVGKSNSYAVPVSINTLNFYLSRMKISAQNTLITVSRCFLLLKHYFYFVTVADITCINYWFMHSIIICTSVHPYFFSSIFFRRQTAPSAINEPIKPG